MKKVLIPTKLDKVVAKILTDAGFEVVQVPDKPILEMPMLRSSLSEAKKSLLK